MATTSNTSIDANTWTLVGGEGTYLVTPSDTLEWVWATSSPSAGTMGHQIMRRENQVIDVGVGESLYVRNRNRGCTLAVTVDA